MRIVAGGRGCRLAGAMRAGVELRLAPGWNTYWRYPGDSGVPPHFDSSALENLKSVLSWPGPRRNAFTDADWHLCSAIAITCCSRSARGQRMLGKPVVLRLTLDYAICEKVCIPVQGQVGELTIRGGATKGPRSPTKPNRRARALAAWRRCAAFGSQGGAPDNSGSQAAGRSISPRPTESRSTVFAEGPSPDWALPVPQQDRGVRPAGCSAVRLCAGRPATRRQRLRGAAS